MHAEEKAIDRRHHHRLVCDLRIWLRKDGDKDSPVYLGVQNISEGGMLCKCPYPLNLNDSVKMGMKLPGKPQLANLDGWVRHVSQDQSGDFLVGIQFGKVENLSQEEFAVEVTTLH